MNINNKKSGLTARLRAASLHSALSALIVLPVLWLVFHRWYPGPWFEVTGAAGVLVLLLSLHLLAAPLLTAVVYRPGKKGLVFDLVVIAGLQLGALIVGAWAIESERPRWVVFSVDRYVPLAEKDVDPASAAFAGFADLPGEGPRYVFAEMPLGRAFQRLQQEVLFEGRPDLERRPEFWRPFDATRSAVLAAAVPVTHLLDRRPDDADAVTRAVAEAGLDLASARLLPLPGKRRDFVALLDPTSAEILAVVPVDPWVGRP